MNAQAILARLRGSPFRARFRLGERDRAYIAERGMEAIRSHARDFIRTRLAPADIPNDGRQTPMRGHPVFIAQHACACCCRGCLAKWHGIPRGVELSAEQQEFAVGLIMAWIERECAAPPDERKLERQPRRQKKQASGLLCLPGMEQAG